jgi:outer membrane protein OmpA-like peptidoglycan-associated protein
VAVIALWIRLWNRIALLKGPLLPILAKLQSAHVFGRMPGGIKLMFGSKMVGSICRSLALILALFVLHATPAAAQSESKVTGVIEWGIWIDPDGCMNWWADGGTEGYMVQRRDPKTGRAVCLKKNTCLVENTDVLFASGSASLTAAGRQRLAGFFAGAGAFGYAVYGHTDSQGSAASNDRLSKARAEAVANVARAAGLSVESQTGFGESRPVASNATAAGMKKNRRVEIVCYKW